MLHSEIKIRACTVQLIKKFVTKLAFLVVQSGKESACNAGDLAFIPGLERFPWRMEWLPTTVFSPGKSHGQRSLVGDSPWGHKE